MLIILKMEGVLKNKVINQFSFTQIQIHSNNYRGHFQIIFMMEMKVKENKILIMNKTK